jgi:hypothetical protein
MRKSIIQKVCQRHSLITVNAMWKNQSIIEKGVPKDTAFFNQRNVKNQSIMEKVCNLIQNRNLLQSTQLSEKVALKTQPYAINSTLERQINLSKTLEMG